MRAARKKISRWLDWSKIASSGRGGKNVRDESNLSYKVFREEVRRIRGEYGKSLFTKTEGVVQYGLFSGLRLTQENSWGTDTSSMLLGTYELEIQELLKRSELTKYDAFIDVGCANGYYAVGLARIWPGFSIYAYDISEAAQTVTRMAAELNGVSDRLEVKGCCDHRELEECLSGAMNPLVMIDIEGGERELVDPQIVPALSRADLVVECHDRGVGDITQLLSDRLRATHVVEIISRMGRNPASYPELIELPDLHSAVILCEMRVKSSHWLWCRKR